MRKRIWGSLLAITATCAPATARAETEWNGAVATENYVGVREGEFFNFRNANLFQLKVKGKPADQVAAMADLELRNTNFTRVQLIDELWDRGSVEPISWRVNEAYTDLYGFLFDSDEFSLDLRAGKQVLAWGEADGFNPSNLFDPYNLENPLDFKQRLGNVALKFGFNIADELLMVDLLLVPRFLSSVLPVALFLGDDPLNNPLLGGIDASVLPLPADLDVVIATPGYSVMRTNTPGAEVDNLGTGARVRWSLWGFDWTMSYAHGRETVPVPKRVTANGTIASTIEDGCPSSDRSCLLVEIGDIELVYPKVDVVGFNLRGGIGDVGVWAEAALVIPERVDLDMIITTLLGDQSMRLTVVEDTPYTKWTVGAEYTFVGGYYFNLQWVHGFFTELSGHKLHDYLFLVFRKSVLADKLRFELSLGGEWDRTLGRQALAGLGAVSLAYKPFDGAEIELGYVMARGEKDTSFGMFEKLDQAYLKIRADF